MRLKIFIIIAILLSFISLAQDKEDYTGYESLDMKLKIEANIDLVPTGSNPRVDFLMCELMMFPINSPTQEISNIQYNVNPDADIQERSGKIIYEWNNPTTSIYLNYESDVRAYNRIVQIPNKIDFPLQSIDPNVAQYIEPTKYIDTNSDIRNKANEIISGEDDYYKAIFKIGNWVRENIEYDLNTLTEKAVQKSSWVYNTKSGVCDEITNLFISMLRSIGIPARFISGVAYTTTVENGWGNHGWAEVYFPEYGWVPFDITYGQFGFVDASHIKLKESADSYESSLVISASTHDMNFNANELNIITELVSKGSSLQDLVRIELDPYENQVGPGSYVPMEIKLKNLQSFYVPLQIRVTKAPELEGSNIKPVLLRPGEEKNIYFTIIIPDEIESGYLYSTVFEIVDSFGDTISEKIAYSKSFETITKKEAQNEIERNTEKEEKSYSTSLDLDCNPEKSYYFDYEKAVLICDAKNIGNTVLNNIDICLNERCEKISLSISKSERIIYSDLDPNQEIEITATSNGIDMAKSIKINALSDPNLRTSNLEYPDKFKYRDNVDLKFLLASNAPVKNVNFYLNDKEIYHLDEFSESENRVFTIPGKRFYSKDNFAVLTIKYEDENGHPYETSKKFFVDVIKVPFYIKILSALRII